MPVLPIDNKMSLLISQDAGRLRDGQLRTEEGQNRYAQENIQAQDDLEAMVKGTNEAEKTGLDQDGRGKNPHEPPFIFPPPKKKDPPKIEVKDGIRGTRLDIQG